MQRKLIGSLIPDAGVRFGDIGAPMREYGKLLGDQIRKEEAVAYQKERDKKADERAAMQDARANLQEGRMAEQFATEKATREANAAASNILTAQGSDVVTPTQADAILAAYNKNPKADVLGLQAKAVAAYNASPVLQKQHMGTVSVGMGPSEQTVQTINPVTGQVEDKILSVAPDMKEANLRKDNLLQGLDRQIESDEARAQQWKIANMQEAGQNKRHKESLAASRENAKEKFQPYTVTVGFDRNGKPTNDPSKMVDKSIVNINSPRVEAAFERQYGQNFQLGSVTLDNTQTSGKSKDISGTLSSELDKHYSGLLKPNRKANVIEYGYAIKQANPKLSIDEATRIAFEESQLGNIATDKLTRSGVNERLLGKGLEPIKFKE